MAYDFSDGFDNYGNNYTMTSGYPWDTVINTVTILTGASPGPRFSPPSGLTGGYAQTGNSQLRKILPNGAQSTIMVLMGFRIAAFGTNPVEILTFFDGSSYQCTLTLNSNGALQFYRGDNATAVGAASANGTITTNSWYGLQVEVTINSSTGSVLCYVNGASTPAINSSGLNTQATSNASASQVGIGASNPASGWGPAYYDDFLCFDSTGTYVNSLPLYDSRVLTKLPTGNGNYTNWTPNGLANNWQNASQTPPNTSDYNSNNAAGTKDSYALTTVGLGIAPFAFIVRASLEKDDGATHTPALMVRSGSTDGVGANVSALSSSYLFYDTTFQNDPATSSPWTGTGADAAQIGVIEG